MPTVVLQAMADKELWILQIPLSQCRITQRDQPLGCTSQEEENLFSYSSSQKFKYHVIGTNEKICSTSLMVYTLTGLYLSKSSWSRNKRKNDFFEVSKMYTKRRWESFCMAPDCIGVQAQRLWIIPESDPLRWLDLRSLQWMHKQGASFFFCPRSPFTHLKASYGEWYGLCVLKMACQLHCKWENDCRRGQTLEWFEKSQDWYRRFGDTLERFVACGMNEIKVCETHSRNGRSSHRSCVFIIVTRLVCFKVESISLLWNETVMVF